MENSKKIIEKIRKENIKPIPKWNFALGNILTWLAFVIFIFIGAAAFSVVLFSIQQTDFNMVTHLSHSKLEFFLVMLPFLWIIALLVFLIAAILTFQRSKKGYKFGWSRLFGLSTAASILLGTLFFFGGGAHWLDNTFAQQVSSYESIEARKQRIWMNPEEGHLSGTIENVSGDTFQLIDFNNKKWNIDYEDAWIPPAVFLEKGELVKLVGEITQANNFYAKEVRPWGGNKKRKRRMEE